MMSLKNTTEIMPKVAIIGGGAAGLMAAISAARAGANVVLFEHNKHNKLSEKQGAFLGKKLRITGKGRCNLTNLCTVEKFLENVVVNPKFLYKALTEFTPSDTMKFFEDIGVPLKTERGNRVFPLSDKSLDIVNALENEIKSLCVQVVNSAVIEIVQTNGKISGVKTKNNFFEAEKVILCTGGLSYKACGSTGDGYRMAKQLGHTVVETRASLVPLESDEIICSKCMGLTLKNVGCRFLDLDGKTIYTQQGELLFTHFGVSGPVILTASAHIKNFPVSLSIDLKPALDKNTLDKRLIKEFSLGGNKAIKNILSNLLPTALIIPFLERVKIDVDKKANEITKNERNLILDLLKNLNITIKGTRDINEAVITSGGISTKEINPSTMESKLVKGLYFAGEIIDCDAYTGGFNLQIAFSTARLAAYS